MKYSRGQKLTALAVFLGCLPGIILFDLVIALIAYAFLFILLGSGA